MVFVGHSERGQAPGIFQFWIQRETVALQRQRSPMGGDFHRAREIMRQGGFKILPPPRRSRREATHRETYGREIDSRVQPPSAVEAHFLWIQLVGIMEHAADSRTLVFGKGMLVHPKDWRGGGG